MNITITGEFDASLSIPIDISPIFDSSLLVPCQLTIDKCQITISPLEKTEVHQYENGEYDSATLKSLRVIIDKEFSLESPPKSISSKDEQEYEYILISATRRLITIIKNKTNQWNLDTRHPIHAYSSKYRTGNNTINISFPIQPDTLKLPEYAHVTTSLSPSDFYSELSTDIWREAADEILKPISIPFYDELLDDAKLFRHQLRYDASVLYAAFAAELMLEQACTTLIENNSSLTKEQCYTIIKNIRTNQLMNTLSKLAPELSLNSTELKKLFNLRDKIAHGKQNTIVTPQQAQLALATAKQLKTALSSYISR